MGPPGSVTAVLNTYPPAAVLPGHSHSGASLSLVFDGQYVERVGRRSWQCAPLSMFYKPPDVEHSNHIGGEGLQALFLEIPADLARSLITEVPTLAEVRCGQGRSAQALVRRVRELVAYSRTTSLALSEELLHACLFRVTDKGSRRPTRDRGVWLSHVRDFLHANYRSPLSLTDVAAVGGVHPVHLAQTFRRRFGCTFRDYVRALRLEAARTDLRDMTRTIGTIGLAAGFADHAHFTRTFRARFGQTPTEYRRSLA